MKKSIALLIPCYNEGMTLAKVVADFRLSLPEATIYIYDNASTDDSFTIAKSLDVTVRQVALRGKGHVVRRMFADIDADIYVMVDGDATYDAKSIKPAIKKLIEHDLDMVVCTRKPHNKGSFRKGHVIGNKWFNKIVNFLFGKQFTDIFSGYRLFSRRFVKSFPAISAGFEIEAEISIHALSLGMATAEIETPYLERPPGSTSKLNTLKDGFSILRTVLLLFLYIRPMMLFGTLSILCIIISLLMTFPLLIHYLDIGLVPKMPTMIVAVAIGLLGAIALACGIILDSISRARIETKRFWYLFFSSSTEL